MALKPWIKWTVISLGGLATVLVALVAPPAEVPAPPVVDVEPVVEVPVVAAPVVAVLVTAAVVAAVLPPTPPAVAPPVAQAPA